MGRELNTNHKYRLKHVAPYTLRAVTGKHDVTASGTPTLHCPCPFQLVGWSRSSIRPPTFENARKMGVYTYIVLYIACHAQRYIKTQSHAISLIRAEDSGLSQNGPVVIASPPRLGTIITAHNHRTWAVRCKEVRTPGSHDQSLSSSNDLDRVINARVFTVTCPAPWCHPHQSPVYIAIAGHRGQPSRVLRGSPILSIRTLFKQSQ